MSKAAHSRFSLIRLVKHFSTGSQSANTAIKPSSGPLAPVSEAQLQAWQCEWETAQTLRDTVQGYVSGMKALGQGHAIPSGYPDNEEPWSCPYDHDCSQLQDRIEEFDKLYPVKYSPALSEWPGPSVVHFINMHTVTDCTDVTGRDGQNIAPRSAEIMRNIFRPQKGCWTMHL